MANRGSLGMIGLVLAATGSFAVATAPDRERMAAGKRLYAANCVSCHQPDGSGVPGEVPPLAGSDFLAKGPERAIAVVLHGLRGELEVHGRNYDGSMPPLFHLDNEEVADVLTYVYNSWGNPGGQVRPGDVAAQRYDRSLAPDAPTPPTQP
jgi:nitrite reductase (NO-forming)